MSSEDPTHDPLDVGEPDLLRTDLRVIRDWQTADEAIAILASSEAEIAVVEAEVNARIAILTAEMQRRTARHSARIARVGNLLREFVSSHRDDMGDKKSRKLAHGVVGFRTSKPSIELVETEAFTVRMLRVRGHLDCIVTKETVDKAKLHGLPETELAKLGVEIEQEERFYWKSSAGGAVRYPEKKAANPAE